MAAQQEGSMSNNVRSDSGDAFHAWEELQISRQDFANGRVRAMQRKGGCSFAELLKAFREAGREYDRDATYRRRRAA